MIEGNLKHFFEAEIDLTKKAYNAHQDLGTSTSKDCKTEVRMSLTKDKKVTTKYFDSAEKYFGQSTGSLKGKTAHSRTETSRCTIITITKELLPSN